MLTERNLLPCPEIRDYRREVVDGRVVITYLQRAPSALVWELVEIVVPSVADIVRHEMEAHDAR